MRYAQKPRLGCYQDRSRAFDVFVFVQFQTFIAPFKTSCWAFSLSFLWKSLAETAGKIVPALLCGFLSHASSLLK